ncbi:hypothetical protein Tco_1467884, partial [Tanacetum coccineum]
YEVQSDMSAVSPRLQVSVQVAVTRLAGQWEDDTWQKRVIRGERHVAV